MCQIIVAARTPDMALLRAESAMNPDGAGVALLMGDGLWSVHRAMALDELLEQAGHELGRARFQLWHFRLATVGVVDVINCQPLPLAGRITAARHMVGRRFLLHNGCIRELSHDALYSDSALLAMALADKSDARAAALLARRPEWGKFVLTMGDSVRLFGKFHAHRGMLFSSMPAELLELGAQKRDRRGT